MAANEGHGASIGAWVATVIMIAAFVVGGVALIVHTWWMFWLGVAMFVVGLVMARAVNIMDQVSEYDLPNTGGAAKDSTSGEMAG